MVALVNTDRLRVLHREGNLSLKIIQFLMHLNRDFRTIYLSRHGQSEYNVLKKIGGDSPLSEKGEAYADELAKFVGENITHDGNGKSVKARLWTSTLQRTILTARHIPHEEIWDEERGEDWTQMRPMQLSSLDEIYAGDLDGLTYEEIKEMFPEEYKERQQNKFTYRYPCGESYHDVIHRLHSTMVSLAGSHEPILIVSHQAVLRLIYCYLTGRPREKATDIEMNLNTVIKLTLTSTGSSEERFHLIPKTDAPTEDEKMNAPSH